MPYGFLPQRGTEDALSDLINHIQNNLLENKSVFLADDVALIFASIT